MRNSLFLLTTVALLGVSSCKRTKQIEPFNSALVPYISHYTAGVISKKSSISIRFAVPVGDRSIEGEELGKLFDFEPEVKGNAFWEDDRTLIFQPDADLKPGEIYSGEFDLSALMEVPDSLKTFKFGFQILRPDFEWGSVQLTANPDNQMQWYKLKGTLLSADEEDIDDLKDLVTIESPFGELDLKWYSSSEPRRYEFTIDSLQRKEQAYELKLKVNKSKSGTKRLNDRVEEMSALKDFRFLGYEHTTGQDYLLLKFSDPIDKEQNLTGLITLENAPNPSFEISNTSIKVYPKRDIYGAKKLRVFPGIKNILGYKFQESKEVEVVFKNEKPQVELIGEGHIIPSGEELLLPFKAISLNAVDVKVVRIAENNILQFLQNNSFNSDREIYRVGEVISEKKFLLTPEGDITDWNTYSLDLADMVKTDPGAIYRVYLSFQKDYSVYGCSADESSTDDDDDEYWYYDDDYYYDYGGRYERPYDRSDYYFNYPRGYRWNQRDNPCHVSYYISNRFVTRNILSTNLGLIVKEDRDHNFHVTVNDLHSTAPISGADVVLYNYQMRPLASIKTNGEGLGEVKVKERPFFVVATKGKAANYVKLESGAALSLGNFKVAGAQIKDGMKGFLYGDRGVWRPGDSLYLNFILQSENELPKSHPVRFELRDPNGAVVERQVNSSPTGRIYDFRTATQPTAITGTYHATVSVGASRFERNIKIETVKPNRLNIDLKFEDEIIQVRDNKLKGDIKVQWLTGIDASEVEVDVKAKFNPLTNPFEGMEGFVFKDPVRTINTEEQEFFSGVTDALGDLPMEADMSLAAKAPGLLHSRFLVNAFEGGGDISIEFFDQTISPFDRYVGVQVPRPDGHRYLHTGVDHKIRIKLVDANGKKRDASKLHVKAYKVDWHWWYQTNRNNLAKYITNEATYMVDEKVLSTTNGEAVYTFRINEPAWGRYLIRVCDEEGGHCGGDFAYVDWPYGRDRRSTGSDGADQLVFDVDKESYEVGDEVVATIPAAKGSRLFVTTETGSNILNKDWVTVGDESVTYRFKATADMAPTAYLSVWMLQPYIHEGNDRPMRLYGVVPINVKDPETELEPIISAADSWMPETEVEVGVREKTGRKMDYSIAIVDEGLLNLTQFKTPDPWSHFYAKEALGIKTWDIYDAVMGAYGGRLEQIFAMGGDGEISKKDLNNMNRFKPMVRFLGPFTLQPGATDKHKVDIPNYIGSVRVMVVSADKAVAYGNAEKKVTVKKPLMVLSTLPRILNPGDEITLPVTVFAMEDDVKNVKVKLELDGKLEAVGASNSRVTFSATGEKVVDFKLKVKNEVGTAKVKVSVEGAGHTAYTETSLNVRYPNPVISERTFFNLGAGRDTTIPYKPVGLDHTNTLKIEGMTMPQVNLNGRLKYLMGYPHGCSEQILSRVFPLLYLDGVMDLDQNAKATRSQNLKIAIQSIYERQTKSGGIKYWPGNMESNAYITSYGGHFILEAERLGYQVPEGMISRWKKYQRKQARDWKEVRSGVRRYVYNDFEQAYRLYTLALAGEPEIGAMNRLRELGTLSPETQIQLAGAYLLIGEKTTASELLVKSENRESYYRRYWYYGSYLRANALKLDVLYHLGQKRDALKEARKIAKSLNSSNWYSTHDLAMSLRSILATYGDENAGKPMQWDCELHGQKKTVNTSKTLAEVTLSSVDESGMITIHNQGKTDVNLSVVSSGIPLSKIIPAESKDVDLKISYFSPDGSTLDVSELRQGQDFFAEVHVTRTSSKDGYENMALTQVFPSGWEIMNSRITETESEKVSRIDYQDIRDDRIMSYFNMRYQKEITFKVKLNATYAGSYFLPPAQVEDMYDNETMARTSGQWIKVVRK